MSKTITLLDHISFEELALEWCAIFDWLYSTRITFHQLKNKRKIFCHCFSFYQSNHSGDVGGYSAADYYPSDRKILIRDEEKFQPILDFIKERSDG